MSQPANPAKLPPAPLFRRLLAILYDSLLLLALFFLASWVAFFLNDGQPVEAGSSAASLLFASMLLISVVYFGWFWMHGGQTLGMKTWRIRLHRRQGMTWMSVVAYCAAALLSWALFGLGFALALVHPQKKTLHDLLCATQMLDLR